MRLIRRCVVDIALPLMLLAACSSAGSGSGASRKRVSSGETPSLGSGGSTSKGIGDGVDPIDIDAATQGSAGAEPLSADSACGTGSETAKLSPVNMFVMMDRSRSMDSNDKWEQASQALVAFFRDPASAGFSVALRLFPDNEPADGCSAPSCSAEACSTPLVDIGQLTSDSAADAHEQALVEAVQNAAADGSGTPMYPALGGAEKWAMAHQNAHPDQKTVVILVTDGRPRGCNEDIDAIAQLASDAHASHQILTYAIGLEGSAEDDMHRIAKAGGTEQGIFIGSSGDAQAELLKALAEIRGKSMSCDFPLPKPSAGSTLDPTQINVSYTPAGGQSVTLAQVPDETKCGTNQSWYYDDALHPTRILLCPAACDSARADEASKLEILIGCTTEIAQPH